MYRLLTKQTPPSKSQKIVLHPPLVSSIAPYPIEVAQACHKDTAMQFANAAQIDESDRRKISAYKAFIAGQTLRNFKAVLWIIQGWMCFDLNTSNELAKMNAFLLLKNVCHFCAFFFCSVFYNRTNPRWRMRRQAEMKHFEEIIGDLRAKPHQPRRALAQCGKFLGNVMGAVGWVKRVLCIGLE